MSTFGVLASQPYSVTISIFRSSCSFVRLESPVEISQQKRHWCTCLVRVHVYMCACAECPRCTAPSLAALVVYSISRVSLSFLSYTPFPFLLFLSCSSQARYAHARVRVSRVCLSESGVLDLSRFPADACKSCLQT